MEQCAEVQKQRESMERSALADFEQYEQDALTITEIEARILLLMTSLGEICCSS